MTRVVTDDASHAEALPREDLDHVLRHTDRVWPELANASVFVTGGTGFFGRWLVESFAAANQEFALNARVVVLTRDPDAATRRMPAVLRDRAIQFVRGDVRDFDFPSFSPTHVIHGATSTSATLNAQRPLEMLDTIVGGTRRTMSFAGTRGVRRVLHLSSGAVYGVQPPDLECVSEDYLGGPDPLDPNQAYAEGKRTSELIASIAARESGFDLTIARCFAFVGPGLPLHAHFAIGNFIRDALEGGPIRIGGDGTPFRSYQHPADLMIWLWTLLVHGPRNRAYNIGSERAISIQDLAHLIADLAPEPCVVVRAVDPDPAKTPPRYVPCTRRAEQDLRLIERIHLPDAIERTIRWHRGR